MSNYMYKPHATREPAGNHSQECLDIVLVRPGGGGGRFPAVEGSTCLITCINLMQPEDL